MLGRVFQQLGLNFIDGKRLVLYPVEDACVIEFVGHEILVGAAQCLQLLVGIYHTLNHQRSGYWHVEAVVLEILFQGGHRVVGAVAADSTDEVQSRHFLGVVIVQHASCNGSAL